MIKCPDCEAEFKTAQGLAGHRRWVHKHPGKKQKAISPDRRLMTEVDVLSAIYEALKSQTETKEALYKIVKIDQGQIQANAEQLIAINKRHDAQIIEFGKKLEELTRMFLSYIQAAEKRFAELEENDVEQTALIKDLKDLIARQYETEEART